MGDRAVIIFTDGKEVSPTVYLHSAGAQVPALVTELATLMDSRKGDLDYAAARFVGVYHGHNAEDNLGLGMWNTKAATKKAVLKNDANSIVGESHGDAGVIVVDVKDFSWKAYGGYLARKES